MIKKGGPENGSGPGFRVLVTPKTLQNYTKFLQKCKKNFLQIYIFTYNGYFKHYLLFYKKIKMALKKVMGFYMMIT